MHVHHNSRRFYCYLQVTMRKLRHRQLKEITQRHTVGESGINPRSPAPVFMILSTMQCHLCLRDMITWRRSHPEQRQNVLEKSRLEAVLREGQRLKRSDAH
jgi:hypothetical protein